MRKTSTKRRQFLAGGAAGLSLALMPESNLATPRATTKFHTLTPVQPQAAPLPELSTAAMVYGRLGFGITPGVFDHATFAALGPDDGMRMSAFVNSQLAGGVDAEVDVRIAQAGNYATLNKSLTQLWADHHVNPGSGASSSSRPIYELRRLKFLRSVYTDYPLRERVAEFWHNHFSVYGDDYYARSTWTSWDRDVIRHNMLGNFKDFLLGTAQHPAMLYYLDNYNNSSAEPNENYARELIELHTLGVENYFGLVDQDEVPLISVTEAGDPWPASGMIQEFYVDNDVYEAARCLTGWRVNDYSDAGDTGEFLYDDSRHDRFQKSVLTGGLVNIDANQGEVDGHELIELLAYHPGTASHIAGKMVRHFMSETLPETSTIVADVATVFYDNRTAPNQLELVFKALFNHPEFMDPSLWQSKLKRPFDSVVSAMRACEADFTIMPDDSDSNSFEYRMDDTGHFPYEWRPPDGYPEQSGFWMSSTALIQTWKTMDWLVDRNSSSNPLIPARIRTVSHFQGMPEQMTPENLLAFWMDKIFDHTPSGGWIGDPVFESILPFILQQPEDDSFPPWFRSLAIPMEDLEDNAWPYRWHERLRGTVSLILASPYFMQR